MMGDRVSDILNQIKTKGPDMWDNAKLTSYIRDLKPPLDYPERTRLAASLVEKHVFLWLDYVSEEIRNLASTDPSYVDFLSKLIGKTRRDLAGGQVIQALTSVGE